MHSLSGTLLFAHIILKGKYCHYYSQDILKRNFIKKGDTDKRKSEDDSYIALAGLAQMTFLPLNIRYRITLKSSQAKKLLNKSFFIICVYICHTFLRQISTFVDFPVLLSPSLTSCIYVCQVWTSLNYNHIRFMTE